MDKEEKAATEQPDPNTDVERDIDRFVENSQGYCQKIYRKTFDDRELEELRKEIKESNEAIKKVKSDWGIA